MEENKNNKPNQSEIDKDLNPDIEATNHDLTEEEIKAAVEADKKAMLDHQDVLDPELETKVEEKISEAAPELDVDNITVEKQATPDKQENIVSEKAEGIVAAEKSVEVETTAIKVEAKEEYVRKIVESEVASQKTISQEVDSKAEVNVKSEALETKSDIITSGVPDERKNIPKAVEVTTKKVQKKPESAKKPTEVKEPETEKIETPSSQGLESKGGKESSKTKEKLTAPKEALKEIKQPQTSPSRVAAVSPQKIETPPKDAFQPKTSRVTPTKDLPKKPRKLVKWMWILAIAGVVGIAGVFMGLSFTDLPTFEELENPKSKLATSIYASNGDVLGRYFIENRVPITFEQLSPNIVNALVATEDLRYYGHSGIDARGLARAVVFMGSKGGASTITQQLAKLLYTERSARNIFERLLQKLKEWITAVKLERSYTKEEIMAMYLNKFSFINGAYGIKAASETYFGKGQDSLRLEEAAVLVGMLQNPSLYNPLKRPERVIQRRNVVLHQMMKYDKISQAEYDKLKVLPLNMTKFSRSNHTEGPAPYFRMEMSKDVNKILKSKAIKKQDGTPYNIYKDGLRVYTTIDPVIQKYAEESVAKKMGELQKKYWKVWKKDDPWTYVDPEKIARAAEEGEAIDQEMLLKIRSNALRKLVTQSKRYLKLKDRYLAKIVAKIESENKDLVLKDYDVERMVKESKEPGYLKKLKKAKLASAAKISLYRKIMKSENWMALLGQARKLEQEAQEAFGKKVPMKIFTYNDVMEKDTVMTPLDSIRYHRMILQTGLLAVEPSTGFVKAWVGGVNHKYFKYDHVRIDRQVGSTFKPFVYSTAILLQGVSPCFKVDDVPQTISPGEGSFNLEKDWTPRNANNTYTGESLTLKDGLRKSKNTVSVYLMKQLGSPMPVVNLVNNMGISKKAKRRNGMYRIPRSPSICLGAVDLQVWEMAGAYTTFANNGVFVRPVTITKIEDKNGKVLYEYMPEERSALPSNVNYVMLQMLQYNLSGLSAFNGIKSEVGGKTGTTNGYSDGWFMGVTPNLVVGTWVGGEDHWIHFKTISNGAGSKMARPIFIDLLKKLEKDPSVYDVKAHFKHPNGEIGIELDCSKYVDPSGGGGNEFLDDIESTKDSVKSNDGFGGDPFGDDEPN